MRNIHLSSISRKLALLVLIAVLPALIILLYTGMEQRRRSIDNARRDIVLLTQAMAEVQEDFTRSTRNILSTLSLLPQVQQLDRQACRDIFLDVLKENPDYQNITLTASNGDVIASGLLSKATNLADRRHVRNALERRVFSAGEFIVSRVGVSNPAFAYAYPVLDSAGTPIAVLTTAIRLSHFSRYYELSALPLNSFVAVTDRQGVRLFFYPPKADTNPIGKPIQPSSWARAVNAKEPGMFIDRGSDGTRRIFAFEPLRLADDTSPYIYMWAGIPEAHILKTANATLMRNLLVLFLCTVISLVIAWAIGKKMVISPIQRLVEMTRHFAQGKLETRSEQVDKGGEFGALTRAFHEMADTLMSSQKALRENEARFRLVMDSLDALVYVADMKTYEVLYINAYGRNLFGDITGRLCWQTLQKGQSGPCSFCTNKFLLNPDGTPAGIHTWEFQNSATGRWYFLHDRAIRWIDGRIVRLEVATDISDRKAMETRLAEETERLAVTLKSIGDGVITTDTQGRIVLINAVAESLTGWAGDQAIGRPLEEVFTIIDEVTRQPRQNPVQQVLASGTIVDLANHTALVAKTGRERSIADSGAPIRDRDGNIIGVVLVFRDITSELRTEQELIKVKKLESIGVLAGGIAHDFNNILVAILGNIDLALLDAGIGENTRGLLKSALKASHQARDLTQQLLTFAKGGEPIKEASSLADVVRDSANFILSGDKVSCRFQIPEDLWLVDIDTGQISQVVQNIILNASQAMPEGGTIEVSCDNIHARGNSDMTLPGGGNCVKMVIEDSGIGIPANMLEKIFDPYFSTKKQGSGLGLAISHSIVHKHNGHIEVRSTPGIGTTFTIYLPASTKGMAAKRGTSDASPSASPCRVLVMDDEEMVRDVVQSMLRQMGHEAVFAGDGAEAIRAYREALNCGRRFDLSIMDLTVPGGMGGVEAAEQIVAIDAAAKIVASSGYSNDPVMASFAEHGFCCAISKPYQLADLKKVIDQFVP